MSAQEHHPESAARRFVAEAQERADKATEGPWFNREIRPDEAYVTTDEHEDGYGKSSIFWHYGDHGHTEAPNAAFIAAARTDVPKLAAMLRIALDALDEYDGLAFNSRTAHDALAEIDRRAEER